MSLIESTARFFMAVKAAREIRKQIELLGLDTLKNLVENETSIVESYLGACSAEDKAKVREMLSRLSEMGITPEMVWTETTRKIPEIAPIMEGKQAYIQSELQKLDIFLKQG